MSCMMQEPENTASLADWIAKLINMDYGYNGMCAPDDLTVALFNLGCMDTCGYCCEERVYNALADLNDKAYAGRYKENERPELMPYEQNHVAKRVIWTTGERNKDGYYTNGHYIVEAWHYKIFKMLQFFNYQCVEDATYYNDLHRALEKLETSLSRFIVMNSDAYQQFKWE